MSESITRGPSWRFLLVAALAACAAAGVGWMVGKYRNGPSPNAPANPNPTPLVDRGELVFAVNCASCHGPRGQGDGSSAATLRPPPRDFAARPWRFEVTRASIQKVTLDGIPGTAMPACRAALAPADVEPLVDYVYRLATSSPPVVHESSGDDILLREAGFTDLRGMTPPVMDLTDAAGKHLKIADLKGRIVMVHFWGTSCVHCLKSMPRFKELEAKFSGLPFTTLHVCTDTEDVKEAQVLADRTIPGLRVFVDATGLGLARFEVQTLPTVWLIAPDGKAIGRSVGTGDCTGPAMLRLIERWLPVEK